MFEEFMGIPLHPLLVHAAVVLVPLLAVTALGYALLPFLRPHLRLVLVLFALAAPGATLLAKLSGDAFRARLIARNSASPEMLTDIGHHRDFGNMTVWTTIGLAVVALAVALAVRPSRVRDRSVVRSGARRVPVATGGASGGAADSDLSPYPDAEPAPPARRGTPAAVSIVLAVLTVAAAAAALYYVFKTGDSGARMVWEGL